ncbi:hypothetical protein JKF63_02317 [Porcisia hertigi]|uniref:Uncharacterized protein n=1 Tax=Porcisia hertigi TaxID=2761500 RepID=A0A836L2X9_9TRYP|nr:hypothetical protein JKF63_02317 [Porcisia hertigi]
MTTPSQDQSDGMRNISDDINRSRSSRQRPQPLAFPPDRTYGTAGSGIDSRDGGSAGVGDSRQSGLLSSGSINNRLNSDSMPLWSYAASPVAQIRDHCHQQWVAVLLAVALLVITFYFVFDISAPMRAEGCVTPFGDLLGESSGVAAYSNCRNDYGGDRMEHFVSVGLQRLYTGFKWHAIEYIRRYWILTSLLTFPPFPTAEHLMLIETANAVNGQRGGRGSSVVPLERYTNLFVLQNALQNSDIHMPAMNLNGEANNISASVRLKNKRQALVQPNDIVVYAKNSRTLPSGHAAVVTAVHGPFSSVAEAGKEVRWFIVKNASGKGRQPMAPESTLPRLLLFNDSSSIGGAAGPLKKAAGNSENATAEEKGEGMASGCPVRYHKVFIVEQNWDNSNWETLSYLTGSDGLYDSSSVVSNGNSTRNGLPAKHKRKAGEHQRNHSRVLLLHEYSDSHGFFLEDTHNNLILGWVRAPSSA